MDHGYSSPYTEDYPSCLMSCMGDSECKSFNCWWHTAQCDLNNKTKYSAKAKLLKWDVSSTYMGLTREAPVLSSKLITTFRNILGFVTYLVEHGSINVEITVDSQSFEVSGEIEKGSSYWKLNTNEPNKKLLTF